MTVVKILAQIGGKILLRVGGKHFGRNLAQPLGCGKAACPVRESRDQRKGTRDIQTQEIGVRPGNLEGVGHDAVQLSRGNDFRLRRPQDQRPTQGGMAAIRMRECGDKRLQPQLGPGGFHHLGDGVCRQTVGHVIGKVEKRNDGRGRVACSAGRVGGFGLGIQKDADLRRFTGIPEHPAKRDCKERQGKRKDRFGTGGNVRHGTKATTDSQENANQKRLRQDLRQGRPPSMAG